MPESKRAIRSDLGKLDATTDEDIARQIADDPETAPELTDEQLEEAELYEGDKFVRRVGRPKGSGKKDLVTLRLDREVLERFRATGPGWQTRINDALRIAAGSKARERATRRVTSTAGKPLPRTSRVLSEHAVLEAVQALGGKASPEEIRAYLAGQGIRAAPSRLRVVLGKALGPAARTPRRGMVHRAARS